MLVCIVEEKKEDSFLVQELRLRTFQRVDLFLACVLKVALNCSGVPFVVTDALAHETFRFESLKTKQNKKQQFFRAEHDDASALFSSELRAS